MTKVTVRDLSKDLGPNAPNSVFVPEANDGNGQYYQAGETFELPAERAQTLIDLGYLDEAKATKKEGGNG